MNHTFKRPLFKTLLSRLKEPRLFIQVLAGPRQTGKTTLAQQLITAINFPSHYASADGPTLGNLVWIEQQWELGRLLIEKSSGALLVLDEIQKIPGWSDVVKRLWDEDTIKNTPLKVLVLGSSPLLIQKGLSESLAGRFELIPVTHWSFPEMQTAFDWSLDQYLYFGGYPGSAVLISDEERWKDYITQSLIETTLSKDILLMTRVDKPALFRRLFQLGCEYSGQILSYQKRLGQLQDAGNTTTLARYLDLLSDVGMITGISKYAGQRVRQRASSPKLQVLNTAFISSQTHHDFKSARQDREFWGRLTESAVGAHLVNSAIGANIKIFYWRDHSREVDFVLQSGTYLTTVEVKSGKSRTHLPGMAIFVRTFSPTRKLLVGSGGIPIEEILKKPAKYWMTI